MTTPTTPYIAWVTQGSLYDPGTWVSPQYANQVGVCWGLALAKVDSGDGSPQLLGLFPSSSQPLFTKVEIGDTIDDIRARIQSDIFAIIAATYTPINWEDPDSVTTGPYPVYDPGWVPTWMTTLPDDITAETVTFFFLER